MAVATSTAIAGVAAAGTLGGSIAGALKDAPSSGGSLPPQLEAKLLKELEDQKNNAKSDIAASYKVEDAYNKRLDYVDTVIKGMMPTPEQQKSLRDASYGIATAFGDPETAKARGYLSENDYNDIQSLRDMEKKANADGGLQDPALVEKLKAERNAFQQNLERSKLSPDQIMNALNKFDATAKEQMFNRGQELLNGTQSRTLDRIGTENTLRTTTAGLIQQGLSNAFTGASQIGANAGARAQLSKSMMDTRKDLGTGNIDNYVKASQINWSSRTRDMLDSGYLTPDGTSLPGYDAYKAAMAPKAPFSGMAPNGGQAASPFSGTGAGSSVNLNGSSRESYIAQQAKAQGLTPAQYKAKYGL